MSRWSQKPGNVHGSKHAVRNRQSHKLNRCNSCGDRVHSVISTP
jgi:hypothetical protein